MSKRKWGMRASEVVHNMLVDGKADDDMSYKTPDFTGKKVKGLPKNDAVFVEGLTFGEKKESFKRDINSGPVGCYVRLGFIRPHIPRKQPKRGVNEEEKAADSVTKPEHYMWIPIECKDVVKHFSCMVGQAIQYQWRHMYKGRPVEDLEKAVECLKIEIARLKTSSKQSKT